MLYKDKKGFTLLELVISIVIICIIFAVMVPSLVGSYNDSKEKIEDIYNSNQTIICYVDEEIVYSGKSDEMPDLNSKYNLIDIKYGDGVIYLYFEDKVDSSDGN